MPRVEQINEYVAAYAALSNDELRAKTRRIQTEDQRPSGEIDKSIAELNNQAEEPAFQ